MSRYELRFSGAGGQGLITAGIIMAKAASIYQGIQAVQSRVTARKPVVAHPSRKSLFQMKRLTIRRSPSAMHCWQ